MGNVERIMESLTPLMHSQMFAKLNNSLSSINIYMGKEPKTIVVTLKEDGTWSLSE